MRLFVVLLLVVLLPGCGKTGALYLPEKAPEPVDQVSLEPPTETTREENAD